MADTRTAMFYPEELATLFEALQCDGYTTVGPTKRGDNIVLEYLTSPSELPIGWWDEQERGHYRLLRAPYASYFGCAVGAQAWKKFLYPSRERLWRWQRLGQETLPQQEEITRKRYAFIGVRGCDLRALQIQAQVRNVRGIVPESNPFIVSVDCYRSVATCFCASIGSGPCAVGAQVDLRLSEIIGEPSQHFFVAEFMSQRGAEVLKRMRTQPASLAMLQLRDDKVVRAASMQSRRLDGEKISTKVMQSLESRNCDQIAQTCLSCANCTLVCPTCFCTALEDVADVSGEIAERWQRWDSCFNIDFSYIHGGSVRKSTQSRYRQWFSHKLGTWVQQYGSSGCVGCGRCITWCPVGIDITELARDFLAKGDADGTSA